jgi:hypothetical protein
MTATVIGDSTNGNVIFCTHYTGSTAAETPDTGQGTLVYMLDPQINGDYASAAKFKQMAIGYSYSNKDGKRTWAVNLQDIWVLKSSGKDNTETFNDVFNWFKACNKFNAGAIYLFIKNFTDNKYLSLGANAAVSSYNMYLKGYPSRFPFKLEEGNNYKFSNIYFVEANM